jgi:hypothetical protein
MTDLLILALIVVLPGVLLLGPLAVLTLGIAAVADHDGNGLVRPSAPASDGLSRPRGRWRRPLPQPGR